MHIFTYYVPAIYESSSKSDIKIKTIQASITVLRFYASNEAMFYELKFIDR